MSEHYAVVYKGHTLGVYWPLSNCIEVLGRSILLGADKAYTASNEINNIESNDIRLATKEDFKTFRVMFHPSYLKEQTVTQ